MAFEATISAICTSVRLIGTTIIGTIGNSIVDFSVLKKLYVSSYSKKAVVIKPILWKSPIFMDQN